MVYNYHMCMKFKDISIWSKILNSLVVDGIRQITRIKLKWLQVTVKLFVFDLTSSIIKFT